MSILKKLSDFKFTKKSIIILIIILVAAVYFIVAIIFSRVFMPGTSLNGESISMKSASAVEAMLDEQISDYELVLEERNDQSETITGESIGIEKDFDNKVQESLKEQNPLTWIVTAWQDKEITIENVAACDETKLASVVAALNCSDTSQMIESENASISTTPDASGQYVIEEETYGTVLISSTFTEAVEEAVTSLTPTLNLSDAGCYENPQYTADSEETIAACETINALTAKTITYDMIDIDDEVIDSEMIRSMLKVTDDMEVKVRTKVVAEYVDELADKYNTAYTLREFTTSNGDTVQINGGAYGWRLDQDAEEAQLQSDLLGTEDVTREPEWSLSAESHINDYGSTYVEVSILDQYVWYYRDGELICGTSCVTGNTSNDTGTHTGIFPLTYKERDTSLVGEDYESEVSYWMPFNGNEGLHDASWRDSFGGNIYKTNGSHGCVNLPTWAAKTIYENIEAGCAVVVYDS